MSNDGKDEEMICALTADEYSALQEGLSRLPDTMPPRAVWNRIRKQAEAEGLIHEPFKQRRSTWYAGIGLAAAALLATVMLQPTAELGGEIVPTNEPSNQIPLSNLQMLMVQSRQIESDLRAMPAEPRVTRAGTIATISDIESRIAGIDYQLNDPEVHMTSGDREIFWRERVRLMNLLLQLRYAQAQRAAF